MEPGWWPVASPPRATVLDPIHGSIQISELEYTLLQTPFLARLHGVKQLGMVHLVYPQAKHSRLEHSLGVLHLTGYAAEVLARRWLCELRLCGERHARNFVTVARLSGLLHDLGHPPFSHAMEEALEYILQGSEVALKPMPRLKKLSNPLASKVREYAERHGIGRARPHEVLTYAFAAKLAERAGEYEASYRPRTDLSLEEALRVVLDVLRVMWGDCDRPDSLGSAEHGISPQAVLAIATLISNKVADTDRLDYIPRDGYNTGVVFGSIDYERILKHLKVVDPRDPENPVLVRLEVEDKGVPAIEDVYDARFKMYRTVYYHHKNIALTIALALAIAGVMDSWNEAALPQYQELLGGPVGLYDPERLADAVAEGAIAYNDAEMEVMIRNLAAEATTGGGGPGRSGPARWARALMWDRRLLPISMIKRPETFLYKILRRAKVSQDGSIDSITEALGREIDSIQTDVAEIVAKHTGLGVDEVDVVVWYKPIAVLPGDSEEARRPCSGVLEVSGAGQSAYLLAIARLASMPIVGVYVFSHDERSHIRIWSRRAELRRIVEERVASILAEALRNGGREARREAIS